MPTKTSVLIASIASAVLFTVAAPTPEASAASITKATYQTTDALNLRASATTSSKKLLTIPKGKSVVSSYKTGNWYKVSYSSKTGYVSGSYLKKKAAVKASTVGTSFTKTNYTTTDSLSLRKSDSAASTKLLTIPKGTTLSSSYKKGSWYKVSYKSKTGYVAGSYLKKKTTVKTSSVGTTFAKTNYITLDALNLRTSNSATSTKLLTIPKGKVVTSSYRKDNWYQVSYGSKKGYVSGSYLKKTTSSSASLPPVGSAADYSGTTMYVLVPFNDSLTLRSGASSISPSIGTLPRGSVVTVTNALHKTKGFVAVKTSDGRYGYVEATYLSLFQPSMSARPLVVLDPGHGGHDVGAARYGIYERDIVMSVSKLVAERLSKTVDVKLTRYTNDYYPSLTDRSVISNAHKTNIFVSIHINAASSTSAYGAENFYYRGNASVALSRNLQKNLVNSIGLRDRGIKFGNLAVLRGTNAPATLTELGFLSNANDRAKLVSPSYQQRYADAVASAILSSL